MTWEGGLHSRRSKGKKQKETFKANGESFTLPDHTGISEQVALGLSTCCLLRLLCPHKHSVRAAAV